MISCAAKLGGIGRTMDRNRAPNNMDAYYMVVRKKITNSTQGIKTRFTGMRLRGGSAAGNPGGVEFANCGRLGSEYY